MRKRGQRRRRPKLGKICLGVVEKSKANSNLQLLHDNQQFTHPYLQETYAMVDDGELKIKGAAKHAKQAEQVCWCQ